MLKENKWKLILSCAVIMLPTVFGLFMWNQLPDAMTTHWGLSGKADGFRPKSFAVFGLPAMMLIFHFLCLSLTAWDNRHKGQSKKALGMVFWIIPLIALFSSGILYAAAFGRELDFEILMPGFLGAMFVFIGNYLPKLKQNRTIGIKVSWTLHNEENWNKTHRFGGKIWVACGLSMVCSIFLPSSLSLFVFLCAIFFMAVTPVAYSYLIYKKHQKEGVLYTSAPKSKGEKIAVRITTVVLLASLASALILLFTGNIKVSCKDSSMQIQASYWRDLEVDYQEIDRLTYRTDFTPGTRAYGFGSPRLSMGTFQNEEFGSYTLYAYTRAKEYLVLESRGEVLAIAMKDAGQTRELYETLLKNLKK